MKTTIKFIAWTAFFLAGCQLSRPQDWKEIQLNCKTQTGGSASFLINKYPPSVKDADSVLTDYQILVFSPSKIIFRSESKTESFPHIYRSEFTFAIDRNNLNYQVNLKTFSTNKKYPGTSENGVTVAGKCSIDDGKSAEF